MALGMARNHSEQIGSTNELTVGFGILAVGILFYFLSPGARRRAGSPPPESTRNP